MIYDVAIVGAGPGGSTCAALCAEAGLSTLIIERSIFPREKVCGDCVNPACWPIFDRLQLSERVLALPHSRIAEVEFIGTNGRSVRHRIRGEIAIKRSLLDDMLLRRARELGAEVREGATVTALEHGWSIQTTAGTFSARTLVAADGRNSTVARLLGLLPFAEKDRIGVQTHFPAPPDFGHRVVMRFLPRGYCGLASVGEGQLNLCLVSTARRIAEIKSWAAREFALPSEQNWRTITPLARAAVSATHANLLLVGDAARIVEPFTGEGIYYALASGKLAARHIISRDLDGYAKAHAQLYRGRLWINALAKQAVLHPRIATFALHFPSALRMLTSKVVSPTASAQR
ncbi:MAG: geranylgeranyl reductase family protein [Chthoniobacteraceae bacterium]